MPGETKSDISGWTTDTLKAWVDREVAHLRDLREADLKYHAQVQKNNETHFLQLNENAKRTIEERGHFLSVEAYEPFRDAVAKYMATGEGKTTGSDITMGKIVTAISVAATLLGLVVLLSNNVLS